MKRIIGILIAIVVVGLAVFCYFRFYFVFGKASAAVNSITWFTKASSGRPTKAN